jgi:hypothetical protein
VLQHRPMLPVVPELAEIAIKFVLVVHQCRQFVQMKLIFSTASFESKRSINEVPPRELSWRSSVGEGLTNRSALRWRGLYISQSSNGTGPLERRSLDF